MAIANIAPWELPLARSILYDTLSLAFLYPEAANRKLLEEKASEAAQAAEHMGWQELAQAAQGLANSVEGVSDAGFLEQYIDIFGHGVSKDCPQYEGEYNESHIFLKSQTLAGLGAFYSAFGVEVNPELKDRLDHISVELEFMHLLASKEAYAGLHGHGDDKVHLCREAQESFLKEHLATWIKSYVRRVGKKAEEGTPYASALRLLDAHMKAEFAVFAIKPAPSRQVIIPLEEEEPGDDEECPIDSPM